MHYVTFASSGLGVLNCFLITKKPQAEESAFALSPDFSHNTFSLPTRHILTLGQDHLVSLFDAQGTPSVSFFDLQGPPLL